MPLIGAIGAAILIYSFSRIMLFLSKEGGPFAFILVGLLILIFATIFALRPTIKRGVIIAVCAIGALGVVSTGVAMAVSGQREIDRHPTTADDEGAQCLRDYHSVESSEEFKEIEHHASQRVGDKSNPMATVVLEDGQLRAYIVGMPEAQQTDHRRPVEPDEHPVHQPRRRSVAAHGLRRHAGDGGQRHRGQAGPPALHHPDPPRWGDDAHRHLPQVVGGS